jgi:large subunit ribosomal protein L29
MKAMKMRELPDEELQQKHEELMSEYFGLRVKHALGQLEDPLVLRRVRRDIARARTLLHERGIEESSRRRRRTGTWVAKASEEKPKEKKDATRKRRGTASAKDEG